MVSKIKFGYEVPDGKEVDIKLAHTVITGLTQEAGKTTAIMGLLQRSGLRALIIKTKIGEGAITEGTLIPPFYKESFDWEYACELLESSRKEKLKFERSWIIKYSKTADSLLKFKHNIDEALANEKLRELDRSVLISLQAYLDKILPELQYAPLSKTLDIQQGINIMDLERFREETQSLIIRSVIDEVLKREKGVIIVLPEAWKYLPEQFASPVGRAAEAFVRQGATNQNYLWLDSQDITGTSKVVLKQVSNWFLGYQREINEIKRTLDQIPLPKNQKPKTEDIATLKIGQFYVATSDFTKKVYAQPAWLDDETSIKIARGEMDVSSVKKPTLIAPYKIMPLVQAPVTSALETGSSRIAEQFSELRTDFITSKQTLYQKLQEQDGRFSEIYTKLYQLENSKPQLNQDEIVQLVLQKMPFGNSTGPSAIPSINEEAIISKVLARVPKQAGSVVYEVAPLEKIRKDFLLEAKNRIITDVSGLSDNAKKVLKYTETKDVDVSPSELITKCLLQKIGGSQASRMSQFLKEILTIECIQKTAGGRYHQGLKERIGSLVGNHGATKEEIEQVYNHILASLI